MIDINLLPKGYKKKKARKQLEVNLPLAVGAVLLLLFIAYVTLEARVRSRKAEIERLSSMMENIRERFEVARASVSEIRPLTLRLERLSDMEKKRVLWARIMNDLSDVFPAELQLNTLNAGQDALVLGGVVSPGGRDESVMKLIEGLKEEGATCFPEYFSVKLESISKQKDDIKQFKIKCKYIGEMKDGS